MSVEHVDIRVGGDLVGHAMSLGTRYVFYSSHPELTELNGRRYESIAAVRSAVTAVLVQAA